MQATTKTCDGCPRTRTDSKQAPLGDDWFSIAVSRSVISESIYLNLDVCPDCMPKLSALVDGAIERFRVEQQERVKNYERHDRALVDKVADEVKRRLSFVPSAG